MTMTTALAPHLTDAPVFEYVSAPGVPEAVEAYAREKVSRLYRLAPGQVAYARVTVERLAGRKTGRHSAARGVIDVGGRLVRAHVEAEDALEAVDLLQERLRERLVRLVERRRDRRRHDAAGAAPASTSGPGEPDGAPRPDGAREGGVEDRRARRRLTYEFDRLLAVRATLWSEGLDAMTETEDIAELSGVDQHPADIGTETFERERDLSILHEVEGEIDAVRRALVRLAQGTYGRCEACGGPIAGERLAAVPATRLCLDDQQRAEAARRY
jgi:RNA polymerase-binding transcription factor DksA/ribosome-associated translation inhibitor RaiA